MIYFDLHTGKTVLRAVPAKMRAPPMDSNCFLSRDGGIQTILNCARGGGFEKNIDTFSVGVVFCQ